MVEWHIERGHYLGEISALCFVHPPPHFSFLPYLLAGTGSQILLYDLVMGKMIRSFQVFEGIRVHGICCFFVDCTEASSSSSVLTFKVAVFGERRVKLFGLTIERGNNSQNQLGLFSDLIFFQSLPKFHHWVLDVCFLRYHVTSWHVGSLLLAIGCSDNSLLFWDILKSELNFDVKCPDRCLLYSMRMWGDNVEALRVASGTIYNEIIVWKVVQSGTSYSESHRKDQTNIRSFDECFHFHGQQYDAVYICRLAGHEGSIFRIAWSSDGSRLLSVSDDRSARIWTVHDEKKGFNDPTDAVVSHSIGPVLFGHCARVWDCYLFDSLIITAGEDCTCRVWRLDGTQVMMIKEHIGRGVWRCLYDPNSSLLVTAGFDSGIKLHQLHPFWSMGSERCIEEVKEFEGNAEIYTFTIPKSTEPNRLLDSRSEYVRCLHFTREDTLYVATNNGYLYHSMVSDTGDVKWTELVQVSEKVPVVCMNLLSINLSDLSSGIEDWVAVGDGKGSMTVVKVVGDVWSPKVALTITWFAEMERQLLGTYWCKSLGFRFIFTADPRGTLKLWKLCHTSETVHDNIMKSYEVSLIAEFISCFGIRILCLDASLDEEVLVCGDLRGNLILFPLLRELLLGTSVASLEKITPLTYFKGAHGISSVCCVSISSFRSDHAEIQSSGGDGCICHLEYDRDQQNLEFIGMKQVKGLSLVQSVFSNPNSYGMLASGDYAIGFASADFIIWNLISETKVVQVPCGGWRRPHSYYLGVVPETKNCFAFVKDEFIYVHRHWDKNRERKIYPQNLHMQFHGREMHSLCFIPGGLDFSSNDDQGLFFKSFWIATGCEDGTVRVTRYAPGVDEWSASKLLGEHIGGSAVRSICCVSRIHVIMTGSANIPCGPYKRSTIFEYLESPSLLISVGAKRVLTVWKQKIRMKSKKEKVLADGSGTTSGNRCYISSGVSSSMLFQWLSTDMPIRNCSTREKRKNMEKVNETAINVGNMKSDARSGFSSINWGMGSETYLGDKYENDWRYLAVTAFLVKIAGSRISVCFVIVACSDATVVLRALLLPHRLWFDLGLLVPLTSPVLALKHVIIPIHLSSQDNGKMGTTYIVISGSTDGSIAFWDLTENIESFTRWVSVLKFESYINGQKRPHTGRGSQGGRWWRSLGSTVLKKKPDDGSVSVKTGDNMENHVTDGTLSNSTTPAEKSLAVSSQALHPPSLGSEAITNDLSVEICNIRPLHVLHKIHQSGVNCLHVSYIKDSKGFGSGFLYNVVSGGDDQALHSLIFDFQQLALRQDPNNINLEMHGIAESEGLNNCCHYHQNHDFRIRFLYSGKITSAHSSAIKGVWTDGNWVFSTGLDQRVRCWHLEEHGRLTERAHLITSVPEPEALDARVHLRDHYQVAVAGRGMQMVEFYVGGMHGGG